MAADMLVKDEDYYYVNENSAMVSNQWVALENKDTSEDSESDHYWYYFQANSKAYKRSNNSNTISANTNNGKKYAFDTDGKMPFGWVCDTDFRLHTNEDTAWQDGVYYFGGEDDGAMSTNTWELISITTDEDTENLQSGDDPAMPYDTWYAFNETTMKISNSLADDTYRFMYFSGSDDGAMKAG